MSTKVKNTLFRFVTMRSPELLDQEQVNQYFVKHPDAGLTEFNESNSSFLSQLSQTETGLSKRTVLSNATSTFAINALKKKENVHENNLVSKRLYDFAIWLTKNRTTFTLEQLEQKLENPTLGIPNPYAFTWSIINEENLIQLWDNLFYQIISGKSPYVRDMILSVLVADFFLKNKDNCNGEIQALRKLAQARVIIPRELFEKENVSANTAAKQQAIANLPVQTKELDLELAVILAKEQLGLVQNQIAEVKKAKNQYDKTTQKAFDLAQKLHNETVADIMANAETVDTTITDPATGQQRTIKEFVNLVIPNFEFEKPQELNLTQLNSKLKPTSINFIENLIEEENLETFDEVLDALNKKTEELTAFITENTHNEQRLVVTNGIALPVVQNNYSNTFAVAGLGTSANQPLQLLFNNSVNSTDVVQADYKIVFDNETEISSTSYVDSIVNNKLSVKIFTQGINLFDKTGFNISGRFTKSNGEVINFSGQCAISEYTSGGTNDFIFHKLTNGTTTYTIKGNGTYSVSEIKLEVGDGDGNNNQDDNDTTDTTGAVIKPYIPSGYGIKRLGIADYRKVEQEVCCYVPGEVSHIENVMAREYKEKSTRRLRRSENTTTTTKEQEIEKLTDTTSTDRFEMNQEVSSVLSEQTSIGVNAGVSYGKGDFTAHMDGSFANNTSSEESNSQAVTHAKEVTERALERVVQKIKEERISKIIEEFEENNKHGFDNTKGDKHVSGVYRWVDKIYKNKVVNYGKRLMYEFMLPKPAHFHYLNINGKENVYNGEIIEKPVDPRTSLKLDATFELNYKNWASKYNVDVQPKQEKTIYIGKALDINCVKDGGASKSDTIQIPEGYYAKSAKVKASGLLSLLGGPIITVSIGNKSQAFVPSGYNLFTDGAVFDFIDAHQKQLTVSVSASYYVTATTTVSIECIQTQEAYEKWQLATFNAIIEAYEQKLADYYTKIAELRARQEDKVRTNPMFYREIENTVLRKNCIEYLASHAAVGEKSLLIKPTSLKDFSVDYDNPELETYAAKVKFFEQAFEWNLMSYFFYPFYWAEKDRWEELYNINDIDDPTFRAFLRSGMARVVLTVRPGFEEAVNWYMATGQVWNGGQVPTMDDELFVSIIEELREPEGEVEETWESRVPTSLTVIQAGSIGLNAQGLPCNTDCNDNLLFDSDGNPVFDAAGNPIKVIDQTNTVLGGNTTPTENTGEGNGGGPKLPPNNDETGGIKAPAEDVIQEIEPTPPTEEGEYN